jgi:hypothetical protein
LIGQEEVVGATDALSKRHQFKKEKASKSIALMFSKHQLMGWRKTLGCLIMTSSMTKIQINKFLKSETTVNKSGAGG